MSSPVLCDDCAQVHATGDWTDLDDLGLTPGESEDLVASMTSALEMLRPGSTPVHIDGYSDCWACESTHIGDAHAVRFNTDD